MTRRKKQHEPAGFTDEGLLTKRSRERVWMPMAGIALAVVLAAIFGMWMLWRPDTKSAAVPPVEPPGSLEEIKTLVARFMAARTPEDLMLLIREPEKFSAPVRDWCASRPGGLPPGGTLLRVVTKRVGDTRLAEAAVRFDQAPDRNLLCVETPAGWRIDWRAFTGVGDMSFPEFVAQKPSTPTVLMTVARVSDYYNGPYANRAIWQCLHIADDTGGHTFYGYIPRRNVALMERISRLEPARSPQAAELNRVSRSLALRVHVAPNAAAADPLQVEVDAVEGEGWFVP